MNRYFVVIYDRIFFLILKRIFLFKFTGGSLICQSLNLREAVKVEFLLFEGYVSSFLFTVLALRFINSSMLWPNIQGAVKTAIHFLVDTCLHKSGLQMLTTNFFTVYFALFNRRFCYLLMRRRLF